MPDSVGLSPDQRLSLTMAARTLAEEFEGVFSAETIELFLATSYDQFADRAKFNHFLPLMAERFARQRLHALAKVEGKVTDGVPVVLFLCVHNAGRSQMALGWFNRLAGDRAIGWSGGSEPGIEVNPSADRGNGGDRHRHHRGVPEAVDERDRAGGRCRCHDGMRRRLSAVPRQALRGLGTGRPGRARASKTCALSATIKRHMRALLASLDVPVS